jgi:hypothetical protein
MKNSKFYMEHNGKVVEAGSRFKHVMAIALDPRKDYKEGIVRCILSREGDVSVSGYIDRSALYKVTSDSLEHFTIGEKIVIKNQEEVIESITGKDGDFIGLEDPDIWIDEETGLMHIYFTLPLKYKDKDHFSINLGHAVGKDLDSLEMTEPALFDKGENTSKEVSIAPINSKGLRYNLIESSKKGKDFTYSTIRIATAYDMGKPWEFGETLFNPEDHNILWVGGHASPGPLFPKTFMDVGENKLLGILNGREANQKINGKIKYGMFSVGLFIYDYEVGKIDWISPEPLIIDSEAVTITFASQFVETLAGKGILYAHIDDSFVRAYSLDALKLKELIPKEFC